MTRFSATGLIKMLMFSTFLNQLVVILLKLKIPISTPFLARDDAHFWVCTEFISDNKRTRNLCLSGCICSAIDIIAMTGVKAKGIYFTPFMKFIAFSFG